MVKTGAVDGYGCRVGRTVPRPTRNSSRVAVSVTLIGNRFHFSDGSREKGVLIDCHCSSRLIEPLQTSGALVVWAYNIISVCFNQAPLNLV